MHEFNGWSSITSSPGSFANTFVGKVTTTDASNASNTNGVGAYASITDFVSFASPFRGWGKDAAETFPASTQRMACSSGNCRIWDWRLKSTDTILRNKNGAFTAGAACPASAKGSVAWADLMTTPHNYLINAWEIIGDSIGNDNGLCESNEACIYQPNIGPYLGEGDFSTVSPCVFDADGGSVSNVTLYAFPTNGV